MPQFRILLTSTLFAQMGLWTQQIALSWLVFDLTDSPLQLGLVAVCSGGTMTVCAPFSGALADRLDRRKVLIVSQFLLASLAVAIATLVATDVVEVWHLYVTAALTGVCFSANGPSRHTLAFDMVTERELASAISLNSIAQNLMRVAGPAVSGILIGSIGVEGAYFVQAVASVVSMLMLSRIRPVTTRRPLVRENIFTSILQGLAYVRRDQPLLLLLTHSVIASICVLGFLSLMPAYTNNALDFGPGGFGLLMSLMGVGGLLGSVFVAGLGYPVGKGKWLVMAAVVAGAMLLGMGEGPHSRLRDPRHVRPRRNADGALRRRQRDDPGIRRRPLPRAGHLALLHDARHGAHRRVMGRRRGRDHRRRGRLPPARGPRSRTQRAARRRCAAAVAALSRGRNPNSARP